MDTDDRLVRVGVFVGVVVVVALVLGVVAALGGPSGPRDTAVAYPNASDMVPVQAAAVSSTAADEPVGGEPRVVLIDDSHANRIDEDDLRPIFESLGSEHEVMYTTDRRGDLQASLAAADAYVVADPAIAYTDEEIDEVGAFVENGGRVVLLGEPTRVGVGGVFGGTLIDIRSNVGDLGTRLGVTFETDYLYDDVNNEGNYKRVFADGRGDLEGSRTAFYTATSVRAEGGTPLLVTPETTRLSQQSEARGHTVAVRTENVMAVGDSTFLTGGKSIVADNERLVRAIAEFAVDGERTRDLADYPYFLPEQPRVRYTSGELLNATKTVGNQLRDSGRTPTLSATGDSFSADRTDVLVATVDDLEASNIPETGVTVTVAGVRVPGYDGPRDGVAVVHRPEGPIDLVIVASSPERATAVVTSLGDGTIRADALSETTAVTLVQPEEEDDDEVADDDPIGGEPTEPMPDPTP
jgi:hypothetical protein